MGIMLNAALDAIKKDMAAGTVPHTVQSFAKLHDYVDANDYLQVALDAAGKEYDPASALQADALNDLMERITCRLQEGL